MICGNKFATSHGSPAPRRFEIHSVEPPVGSEEGGARVTVRGIGFGDATVTNQVGPLGSPGSVAWEPWGLRPE